MRKLSEGLISHLKSGATTISRCWKIERKDGTILGFSDHDNDLTFDGVTFEAASGLDATALQTANGLSVDNTEATGALSSERISEADISAGKFDGAEVTIWLVNWQNPIDRYMVFRGNIGEITYGENSFTAELRGFSDRLNNKIGRNYLKQCSAALGDEKCQFNLSGSGMQADSVVRRVDEHTTLFLDDIPAVQGGWFTFGTMEFLSGKNVGAIVTVMSDKSLNSERQVSIVEELYHPIEMGDKVKMTAGCDKQASTCRGKFQNILNFQGFPFIPGEDWMMSVPTGDNSQSSE
tara:strand:+ start:2674 stop:3552 length:879 start_codon:yes stop_codon:yes gene_type:complete